MGSPNARISRVHGSWRVRVFGHTPKFFADSDYGGKTAALAAARAWRDARWDGKDRNQKLSLRQKKAAARSKDHYEDVAQRYGITPNYVHKLRRKYG